MSDLSYKKGDTVSFPFTDEEGEASFGIGQVIDINKRLATIESNGKQYKVGRTKPEPVEGNDESEDKETVSRRIDRSRYVSTKCASGRKSLDNGDAIALKLRGKPLEDAYVMAAEALEVTVESLIMQYQHLNNGQQRMCLGNRIRGHFK